MAKWFRIFKKFEITSRNNFTRPSWAFWFQIWSRFFSRTSTYVFLEQTSWQVKIISFRVHRSSKEVSQKLRIGPWPKIVFWFEIREKFLVTGYQTGSRGNFRWKLTGNGISEPCPKLKLCSKEAESSVLYVYQFSGPGWTGESPKT